MKTFFKSLCALALTAVVALPGGAGAEEMTEINWGLLAVESKDNLLKRYKPFIELMENRLGMKVNTFFATDYTGMIEAMRFDKVDIVLFGNKSAMTAVDRAGGEVFAQEVELSGDAGYHTILVTQKDNDKINSLEDVLATCGDKSLDYGIGDPQSTSGYLVPMTYVFGENNVMPKDCFKRVINASHEGNLMAAANGQVDVATAHNIALHTRLAKNAPEAAAKLKEIWRSPVISSDPLIWRANLPEAIKAKLYHAVMTAGRQGDDATVKAEREALAQIGLAPFKPSSNHQLVPFRILEANKQILLLDDDETMTEVERAAKRAELTTELTALRQYAKKFPQY